MHKFVYFYNYFNKFTISKLRLFCARDNQHFPTQKHLPLQESDDRKTYYLKIHAPWEVLATYADVLKIKVPFKASDIPKAREVPLEWLTHPFRLPDKIMRPEPDYFTAPFDKSKVDFFLIDDKDTFFPPSTRNRIVYYILTRCPYYKEDRKEKIRPELIDCWTTAPTPQLIPFMMWVWDLCTLIYLSVRPSYHSKVWVSTKMFFFK